MINKLNRCPFCGGEAELLEDEKANQVKCKTCGAKTLWDGGHNAEEKWDKRSLKVMLLPCPCCGSNARVYKARGDTWIVQCNKCFVSSDAFKDKHDAIDAWNKRFRESESDSE